MKAIGYYKNLPITEPDALVDVEIPKPELREDAGKINAENLKRAHAILESGRGFGKTVLSGF